MMLRPVPQLLRARIGCGPVASPWWDVWEERRHRAEPDQLGWLGGPPRRLIYSLVPQAGDCERLNVTSG